MLHCLFSWFFIHYINFCYFIAAADFVSKKEEILLAEATSILENRIKKLNESG